MALCSSQSKQKLAADITQETHWLSNTQKEKQIKDYVERETALARKRVDNAETVIKQELEDTSNAEHAGLTTREPEKAFEEMKITIRESQSDYENPDNVEDGKDENV